MAEKTTIARPYAQAVFELARRQNAYAQWGEVLHLLATVMADERVRRLTQHPRAQATHVENILFDLLGEHLDPAARNFTKLLIAQRRLSVLPEIAALYALYRAEAERTQEAEVISAIPLSEEQRNDIVAALKRRLQRDVTLNTRVDASLLGGAIIRAGDVVIDGSLATQLNKLAGAMTR